MATLRTGTYGEYYGSTYYESEPLTAEEQQLNARYIYSYLFSAGWHLNAISAMLGNMQAESSINPGRWQSDRIAGASDGHGYGLVQWTPYTKYTTWCAAQGYSDPSEMDNNLSRILYEVENNMQWIATNSYSMSFKEFSTSTDSVADLAKAFLLNYERPADQSTSVQNYRAGLANAWYTFLTGESPEEPNSPNKSRSKRKYKFVLFNRQRRRQTKK